MEIAASVDPERHRVAVDQRPVHVEIANRLGNPEKRWRSPRRAAAWR
jgi:hypothetical protein